MPESPIPPAVAKIALARVAVQLAARERAFVEQARLAILVAGPDGTTIRSQAFALQREAAAAEELRTRVQLFWDTCLAALEAARCATTPVVLSALLLEARTLSEQIKLSIFEENRGTIAQFGHSYTHLHLDYAQAEVLQALEHDVTLRELAASAHSPLSLAELSAPRYATPYAHWEKVGRLLRADPPDHENATKEAITTVEALAKVILNLKKASLGKCLDDPRLGTRLDPGLVQTLKAFWGYTSNRAGVRHAGTVPPEVSAAEAQFGIETSAAALRLLLRLDATSFTQAS